MDYKFIGIYAFLKKRSAADILAQEPQVQAKF